MRLRAQGVFRKVQSFKCVKERWRADAQRSGLGSRMRITPGDWGAVQVGQQLARAEHSEGHDVNPAEGEDTTQAGASSPRALARRLIARAALEPNGMESEAYAARAACEAAARRLSRSLGSSGFVAMLTRALAQADVEHPLLKELRVAPRSEPILLEISGLITLHGAPAVAAALEATLEGMFGLLGRLIGEDMVVQLVDRSPIPGTQEVEDTQ